MLFNMIIIVTFQTTQQYTLRECDSSVREVHRNHRWQNLRQQRNETAHLRLRIGARLHIPAGILRIPVFSVPIACFSQESQFSFRSNLVFRNKQEQKPSQ